MLLHKPSRASLLLVGALCAVSLTACRGGKRRDGDAAKWVKDPSTGKKTEQYIEFPELGVWFQFPDTLYVFRDCGEAGHTPQGEEKWVPVITCQSTSGSTFGGFDGPKEETTDEFAEEDRAEASGVEQIGLTIYATQKTRPIDERAVAWFENQYKQAGLDVDEIAFQHDYMKKSGIYSKLHVVDGSGTPTREIVQFMFPKGEVLYIARMEYPFGETRSVDRDWQSILWYFDFEKPDLSAAEPVEADESEDEDEESEE